MPNFGSAWAVSAGAFVMVFGTLSVHFDPLTAFALSLAAMLVTKS